VETEPGLRRLLNVNAEPHKELIALLVAVFAE
jgi:hypothetical protein